MITTFSMSDSRLLILRRGSQPTMKQDEDHDCSQAGSTGCNAMGKNEQLGQGSQNIGHTLLWAPLFLKHSICKLEV